MNASTVSTDQYLYSTWLPVFPIECDLCWKWRVGKQRTFSKQLFGYGEKGDADGSTRVLGWSNSLNVEVVRQYSTSMLWGD